MTTEYFNSVLLTRLNDFFVSADVDFNKSSGEVVVQQLNRLQNELKILSASPSENRAVKLLLKDSDEAWIDISHSLLWVQNHSRFLHLSEGGGWRQLYLVI